MKKLLALVFVLFAATAQAQTANYLILSSRALCLARSQQQCQAMGCDGVHTIYWWDCSTGPLSAGMVGPTAVFSGSYAMAIMPSGPYSAVGLTASEQSKLATPSAVAPLEPVVTRTP